MLPITQLLLTSRRNRPFLRDPREFAIRRIKGIVAHWTANLHAGADATANRNYFNHTDRFASAHYIIDDHSIIQCLPDNEVGYHVGALRYRPDGERVSEGDKGPNYFLIGFEMCVNKDGNWNKTYRSSVELAAHLLRKYQFTVHDLYRHYDITGKDCPKMMIEETAWANFKKAVEQEMSDDPATQVARGKVISPFLNVRSGPGTNFSKVDQLAGGAEVRIYDEEAGWYAIGYDRWVSGNYIQLIYKTQLGFINNATGANIRKGPAINQALVDMYPNGAWIYITHEVDSWYEIGPSLWVHKSVVKLATPKSGIVAGTDKLNVRTGPGTDYKVIRVLPKGTKVTVTSLENSWCRLGPSQWAHSSYIKLD